MSGKMSGQDHLDLLQARLDVSEGGIAIIPEKFASHLLGDKFVEYIDSLPPGGKHEITITRNGKVLGRVTIER